jgi:hypothetical protein
MKPYDQPTLLSLLILLTTAAIHPAAASDLSKNDGVIADSTKPGFRFKAEKPLVIAEPVRIPREVSSVCSFVVDDGPAAADVTFSAGVLEVGGACGFTKDGPTPFSPPSGPPQRLFQGPPAKSKFLAATHLRHGFHLFPRPRR